VFSLNFRELWSPVSNWLTDELDQMAAAAQAKWFAQHAADGTHGEVTASALQAPVLGLGAPLVYRIPLAQTLTNVGVPIVLPRRTSFVSLIGDAAGTYASVDSIEVPGAQPGDILVVHHGGYVRLNSKAPGAFTSRAPGNRLIMDSTTAPDITYGGETFGQTNSASRSSICVTFIRHPSADFTNSLNDSYPAWVQIG
jgi:hypothetical protein